MILKNVTAETIVFKWGSFSYTFEVGKEVSNVGGNIERAILRRYKGKIIPVIIKKGENK